MARDEFAISELRGALARLSERTALRFMKATDGIGSFRLGPRQLRTTRRDVEAFIEAAGKIQTSRYSAVGEQSKPTMGEHLKAIANLK